MSRRSYLEEDGAGTGNQSWGWSRTTRPDWSTVPSQSPKGINVLTAHAVSPRGLVHNHESCKEETNWTRPGTEDFLGPAMRDRDRRGGALVFLQTSNLMGDWCRQVGTTRSETDTNKFKETTAKGERLVTPSGYDAW